MTRPSFTWQPVERNEWAGVAQGLTVRSTLHRGLHIQAGVLTMPGVLSLEVVDAHGLGAKRLDQQPETLIRQDTLVARFGATNELPVECEARWRVLPQGVMDLQVSALTPGTWNGLAVQTLSVLGSGEVELVKEAQPAIVVFRPEQSPMSYVEFCHPDDGVSVEVGPLKDTVRSVRFRLFGHDLEKGVILRGKVRGLIVPRTMDLAAAWTEYQRFLAEPPVLT